MRVRVFTVSLSILNPHLKIQPFNSRFEVLQSLEQCVQSFSISIPLSPIRHGQLNIVRCDKMSVQETEPNGYSIPTGSQSRIMFCHSIHGISLKFYEAFRCCCCSCTLVSCVHQQYPIHSASTICAHYSTSNEVIEFHGKQSTK